MVHIDAEDLIDQGGLPNPSVTADENSDGLQLVVVFLRVCVTPKPLVEDMMLSPQHFGSPILDRSSIRHTA